MGMLPTLPMPEAPTERIILQFGGYSNDPVISSGQMRDMLNLSSDQYPYLTQRQPRGKYSGQGPVAVEDGETAPATLPQRNDISNIYVWKDGLVVVAGTEVYYKGKLLGNLSEAGDKNIVGIREFLCIFPDRVYFDSTQSPATLKPLGADTGKLTSQSVTLWSDAIAFDTALPAGLFTAGDAVTFTMTISGAGQAYFSVVIKEYSGALIKLPANTLNETNTGYTTLVDWGEDVEGQAATATEIRIERQCPRLDFVIECQNRLWGASIDENTIYSSKRGDPTNWFYFTSGETENAADSWAVPVGTDGPFTGAAAFPSHLVFFKEQYIHKLYGQNKPSTYQIYTMECNGMENGSFKSAVTVDGVMYYKSPLGIMAYTGDYPVHITSSFRAKYKNAAAGTDKSKYWISMQNDATKEYEMFCYDFSRKMWHKEDSTHALQFANLDGRLMYIDKTDTATNIQYVQARSASEIVEADRRMPWMAEFGEFDEIYEFKRKSQIEKKKVYSKIHLRFTMEPGADMTVWMQTDGLQWIEVAHIESDVERSVYLPVIPRRCDKFKIRLEGHGRTRIESLMRTVKEGSAL